MTMIFRKGSAGFNIFVDKVIAALILLYGSPTWTLRTQDTSRIKAAEEEYLSLVKGKK